MNSRLIAVAAALCLVASSGFAQTPRTKKPTVQSPMLTKQSQLATNSTTKTKRYEKDNQPHPGQAYRVDKMRPGKWGDTRVLQSVAGHAVIYAKQRYGISDIVTDADYERASKEMYDYLSWKYGNPSLVAAQWITAGYQHFDNFAAEAAGALMGMELPGPGNVIRLPKEATTWLKAQVDSMQKDPNYNPCLGSEKAEGAPGNQTAAPPSAANDQQDSGEDGSGLVGAACELLIRLAAEAAKQAIEKLGISSEAFNMKRDFNVNDSEAEFLILMKRNPPLSLQAGLRPIRIIGVGEGGSQ